MRAKEELLTYRRLCNELKHIEERISMLKAKIESPRIARLTNESRGCAGRDPIGDYIARLERELERHEKKWDELIRARSRIERVIFTLSEPYRELLTYRYLQGRTLTETAALMRYDYKWCCKLHGRALTEFEKTTRQNTTLNVLL